MIDLSMLIAMQWWNDLSYVGWGIILQMMSALCNLEVNEDLVSRLEDLADRHVRYGCLPSHCKFPTLWRGCLHLAVGR